MSFGPRTEPDPESALARTAREMIRPMQRAIDRYRRVIVLQFIMLVLIAGLGVIGYCSIKSQASAACTSGNTFRHDQNIVWQQFLSVITQARSAPPGQVAAAKAFVSALSPDPAVRQAGTARLVALLNEGSSDPDTRARAAAFLAYVHRVDAQRRCP